MVGRRKGGSPSKTLLEGIVTAFLIGVMLVILAVTPAWDAIVDATGIGHHVDVSSLFRKDPVRPDGLETILKPGQSGGQKTPRPHSRTVNPTRRPRSRTIKRPHSRPDMTTGRPDWMRRTPSRPRKHGRAATTANDSSAAGHPTAAERPPHATRFSNAT